ncbi:MAG TPA: F0F1 ATP synthase subunit B [Actinomycetota bacterium]|nr:F0F1 ATP synthase subunit B [Actinomycetota bacterium]
MGYLATIFLFAAEEGAEHAEEPTGMDLILPAVDELVWGAVAFALVLFVLNKFAFPKLREAVEAREKQIQSDLESAEQAKNEAEQEKKQYQQQIADARGEANRIVEEARQQAEQVRKDIIAKAEKDAEQITSRAQESIEAERSRTVQELQSTIADMSIQLAEKVVGRSIDAAAQREMVDAYIKDVAGMGSGNGKS